MEATKKTNKSVFLLQGLLFILIGLILIIFPATLSKIAGIVIAVALILVGISAIWVYIKDRKNKSAQNEWYLIVGATIAVALAIWLLFDPSLLIKLLALTIGIWMLIRSIQIIGTAITVKSFGAIDWLWFILVGLVIAIFAIIFILYPTLAGNMIMILAGIAFLLIGIYYFLLLSKKNDLETTIKND